MAEVAIALSGGCDADVVANAGRVRDELAREEGRFRATLAAGEKVLNDSLEVETRVRMFEPLHVTLSRRIEAGRKEWSSHVEMSRVGNMAWLQR